MKVTKKHSLSFARLNVSTDKGLDELEKIMREKLSGSKNYYLAIGHGYFPQGVKALKEKVPDLIKGATFFMEFEITPVISAHIGDESLGFFYLIAD